MIRTLLLFCLSACSPTATALPPQSDDLKQVEDFFLDLPSVLSDGCVLQRNSRAPLWGWARPGDIVSVFVSWDPNTSRTARVESNGAFSLPVATPEAGGPHTIGLRVGDVVEEIRDVWIGEVWFCSGQSNMEWALEDSQDAEAEIAAADHPNVRLFSVPNRVSVSPELSCGGEWQVCTPETARPFSAVAYFFGRELSRELDVPVGLIAADWGGTPIESWMSAQTLRRHPDFTQRVLEVEELARKAEVFEAEVEAAVASWWSALDEDAPGWHGVDFDDSAWKTMELPGNWEKGVVGAFDGVVRFRREVTLSAELDELDLRLSLGPIDDFDRTYFNGVLVGSLDEGSPWSTPREYEIPAELTRRGKNVIAVHAYDTGGAGGFHGSPEQMRLVPDEAEGERGVSLAGAWRYSVAKASKDLAAYPRTSQVDAWTPTALFNGMVAPIMPHGIRGVLWYQGESNRERAFQYRSLMAGLIDDWRRWWMRGKFPFLFVQIAPYRYEDDAGEAAELREAQRLTLELENTGMVVTTDIGNPRDIHPRNKQEVGRRLALWALATTYGRDVVHSGPLFTKAVVEGESMRVHFDHAEGLRVPEGDTVPFFEIAGADGKYFEALAVIDGESVLVAAEEVPEPVAVRYLWGAADEGVLRNGAGLPASSFKSDEWGWVTGG